MLNNCRLETVQIIGQSNVFSRQMIPEVTAGFDTLITCGNGDEKFIQRNRVTNRPSTKIKKKKQLSSTRLISKKQKGLILETSAQTWREYSMQGFVKKLHRRNQSSNFLRGSIIEGVVLAIQAI